MSKTCAQLPTTRKPSIQEQRAREDFGYPWVRGKSRWRDVVTDYVSKLGGKMSARTARRIEAVQNYGVPELVAMLERREISIHAASEMALFPQDLQREIVAKGPKVVRRWANMKDKLHYTKQALRVGELIEVGPGLYRVADLEAEDDDG